jgi:hypothetical protein
MKNTLALSAAAIALLLGSGLTVPSAKAGYVVDVTQVGSDVVATGSGAIDLTGLSLDPRCAGRCFDRPGINPPLATIFTGFAPFIELPSQVYVGFTGPTSFGPTSGPGSTLPSSGSGEIVGIDGRESFPCHWAMSPTVPCRTPRPISARPSAASA